MSIPSEIAVIIERLNQELSQIEQEATEGLNTVRVRLEHFPENAALIQVFAILNNYILFVEISRRRIDYARIVLLSETMTNEQIQEAGETLSELLGRVLEAKVIVSRIKNRLDN
jgi:hypothetical protein